MAVAQGCQRTSVALMPMHETVDRVLAWMGSMLVRVLVAVVVLVMKRRKEGTHG